MIQFTRWIARCFSALPRFLSAQPTRGQQLSLAALGCSLVVSLWASTVSAQSTAREGALISLDLQLSQLNGGTGVLVGIEGGWESRGGVRMGGALYDLLNGVPVRDRPIASETAEAPETKLHYFGFWIGKHLPLGALGITGDVLLGAGDVSAYHGAKKNDFDRSWFLVMQPCVGLDFPKLGPLLLRLSVGYRVVSELSNGGTDVAPLAGPVLQATGSFVNL